MALGIKSLENSNGSITVSDQRDHRADPTPEQREAERRHNQMTRQQVQKEFGWSDADFAQALSYGFGKMGAGNPGMDNYRYDRLRAVPWVAELKAFGKRLP